MLRGARRSERHALAVMAAALAPDGESSHGDWLGHLQHRELR